MTAERSISTFRLDDELRDGLRLVWERDGIQPSEQVRRAIRAAGFVLPLYPNILSNRMRGLFSIGSGSVGVRHEIVLV